MKEQTKTYRIGKRGMVCNGEEVSDQFFGSESPSRYDTSEAREYAVAQWIDLGWMSPDDTVIWEFPAIDGGNEMTQHELCTARNMNTYMPGAYSLWVGDTHVTCQDVSNGYFVFVYDKQLSQLYSANNVEIGELGFYLDKAIQIAKKEV